MTTVNPNQSSNKFYSFSACDDVAAYYNKLNLQPAMTKVGPLGGKSFMWIISRNEKMFSVGCTCNAASLGFGILQIESRDMDFLKHSIAKNWFRKCSVIDLPRGSGKIQIKSPLGFSQHETNLPIPERN